MTRLGPVNVHSMPRSGHNAIMNWIEVNSVPSRAVKNHERGLFNEQWEIKFKLSEKNVIVVRDPFNFLASYAKKHNLIALGGGEGLSQAMEHWRVYADEAFGRTDLLPGHLFVNFNLWFQSEEYRQAIAEAIGGMPTCDKGLQDVKFRRSALTSSFDGAVFHGRAQEMNVLERWKNYENEKVFLDAFSDDVRSDAKEHFGMEIP